MTKEIKNLPAMLSTAMQAGKKPKRKLTRKQAIKKGNKEFKNFTRELAKSMNIDSVQKLKK